MDKEEINQVKNGTKIINRHFTEFHTGMANIHMKRDLASLFVKEI